MIESEFPIFDFLSQEKSDINGIEKKIFNDWLTDIIENELRVKHLINDIKNEDYDQRCNLILEWLKSSYELGFSEAKRLYSNFHYAENEND